MGLIGCGLALIGGAWAMSARQSPAETTAQTPTPAPQTITGRLIGAGAECPQFQLNDGEVISLSGVPRDMDLGAEEITLQGNWQMLSYCMQGRTYAVTAVVPED